MKVAHIRWQEETGQPISEVFNDVYFSRAGGLAETEHVFLAHNQLKERFSHFLQCENKHFIIAETGFGTGLNFLATVHLWRKYAAKTAKLSYYSAEKYPLTKTDLKKALDLWPELSQLTDQLVKLYPETLYDGVYHLDLFADIELNLLFGDAKTMFQQMDILVDAWYLDGFAPSKNPSMWTDELFSEIAKLSKSNTTFATFSAASLVKKGLEAKGFNVLKDKGFGCKRDMLYGFFNPKKTFSKYSKIKPWFNPQKSNQSKITSVGIIGGGLAGCAIAYELAKSNIYSTIYEEKEAIAQGASGNPVGMLRPYITLDYNYSDQFHSTGFILLEQFLHQYQSEIEFNQSGLLQIANQKEIAWFQKLKQLRLIDSEIIQLVDAEKGAKLANIPIQNDAFFYPKAIGIKPQSLCHLWCDLAGDFVTINFNTKIIEIAKTLIGYSIKTNNEKRFNHDAMIIAGGYDAIKQFEQTAHLPVFASIGQITKIKSDLVINTMLSDGGYLAQDLKSDEYILGATYRANDDFSLDVRISDQLENLSLLEKLGINQSCYQVISERASMRCVTSDHMPLIGQVHDPLEYEVLYQYHLNKGTPWWKMKSPENHQGLYIASGFGSKGIASSLLAAKLIRNMISGSSAVTTYGLLESVHPARFLVRQLKSGQ